MIVYCIPHAGGTERAFSPLRRVLKEDSADIVGLTIPGKGKRFREAHPTDLAGLIADLAGQLDTSGRYALLGHSLGGILAYELAVSLAAQEKPPAEFVAIAATVPPHLVPSAEYAPLVDLPDVELLSALTKYGAIPQQLRDSPLRRHFTPVVRADLALAANYVPKLVPLSSELRIWYGNEDASTPREQLAQWARYTTGGCRLSAFPGGHFFLQENPSALVNELRAG